MLKQVGLNFKQIPSHIDEHINGMMPEEYVMHYAQEKAEEIQRNYPDSLIIGADTTVVLHNEIIGKPADKKDAFDILHKLSGQCHEVVTGVALYHKDTVITDFAVTKVSVSYTHLTLPTN